MNLRYLLDTSTISVPAWKSPDERVLNWLRESGAECAIAAPVWHELVFGYTRLPKGRRRNTLEAYVQDVVRALFPVLPYDEAAAAWHAKERVRLESVGRARPFVDGQIAAIAKVNGLDLVTGNARDFLGFHGLRVKAMPEE